MTLSPLWSFIYIFLGLFVCLLLPSHSCWNLHIYVNYAGLDSEGLTFFTSNLAQSIFDGVISSWRLEANQIQVINLMAAGFVFFHVSQSSWVHGSTSWFCKTWGEFAKHKSNLRCCKSRHLLHLEGLNQTLAVWNNLMALLLKICEEDEKINSRKNANFARWELECVAFIPMQV